MSLLGDLAKQALGNAVSSALGGHSQAQPGTKPAAAGGLDIATLAPIAMALIQQAGGVQAVLSKLQTSGLGDQLQSWIGTGANMPISGEQLQSALGGNLEQAARDAGQQPQAVASGLAQVLPGLIDQLSPKGELPGGGLLEQGLQAALKGGLGKLFG